MAVVRPEAAQKAQPTELLPVIQLIRQQWVDQRVSLDDAQLTGMAHFLSLLNQWNRVHSLTAIEGVEEQVAKHLLDALAACPLILEGFGGHPPGRVADIGSGMGVPGLIWAMVMTQSRFDLIERQQKKSAFLTHVVGRLGLQDRVQVVCQDVRRYRPLAPYDLIVSRAFAALGDFVQFSINLSGPSTKWVAMTGKSSRQENKTGSEHTHTQSAHSADGLPEGFSIIRTDRVHVPGLQADRHLVWVEKKI